MNNFQRVQQWLTFSRQWHLLDAKFQDPNILGKKIAGILRGMNKPLYSPRVDCGDHVIVYNCRHVAMKAFMWRRLTYEYDNFKHRGLVQFQAWEIHRYQPTRVLFTEIYKVLGGFDKEIARRHCIQRLHLFPDEEVPDLLLKNVGNQLRQVLPVPRRSDEYTTEERESFPAIFDWPEEYIIDPGNPKLPYNPPVNPGKSTIQVKSNRNS